MSAVDLFEKIVELRRQGQSFAVGTVVARRAPVSAHLGDRAIVFADGRMEGFVGGACAREIIRKQALEAMQARCGRLVSIRPEAAEAAESTPEHVFVPMTCVSEGAVDVYVEPFVQPRRLIIVGATPVAESLARIARTMEYAVMRVVESREQRDIEKEAATLGVNVITLDALEGLLREGNAARVDQAAVVASQGHYDEQALESILKGGVPYVGLVASRKRGATVCAILRQNAVPDVEKIRIPAGIDLGARTPPEVALSILAEIVQLHPATAYEKPAAATATATAASVGATPTSASAVDPVCGMQVDIATAHNTAKLDDVVYYFCCANCRMRFINDPSRFRTATP